jgi:uncharacterized membrane protein
VAKFATGLIDNPKGSIKTVIGIVLFIAVLVVAWAIASDEPLVMASGETYTDATMLKMSDMMIYSIYALLGVAAVATILNLTGIFKK